MQAPEAEGAKLILLVEDEALIALAESHVLKGAGYAVETAATGEAAVRFAEGPRPPDLILMDIDLGPGIDGTEAAAAILAKREIPIVFLTSHSSEEMVRRVRGITRYGYVIKNSGNFVLLSSIEMAFELYAKELDLAEKNYMLQRAEEIAGLGYWYVRRGSGVFRFSPGSQAILGLEDNSISFGDFRRQVLSEASAKRDAAFTALVEEGRPYDLSYRIARADTGAESTIKSSGRLYGDTVIGVIQDVTAIEALLGDLKKSEERQAVTLRSIGDGVIATDREGRVVELNRMAEALTGWKTNEAIGRPIHEIFQIVNSMTRLRVENPISKVLDTGYIVGLANHTVLIARDGRERHIADSAAPIRDDRGELLGVVLVFRDVTEEYRDQEQLRRDANLFKTLFTDFHTPMLLIDPKNGAIRNANQAASRFYGWSLAEMTAMGISRINTLKREEIDGEMKRALAEGKAEFRFVHRFADGSERPVIVSSGPVRLDGEELLLSVVNDAAETIRVEEEMRGLRQRSETILQDARHRLKNNVQMLSSLIGLQIAEGNRDGGEALLELQNRIASMALVQEHLYVKDGQELVGSREYLGSLLKSMESSYFPKGVILSEEIEDLIMSTKFAVDVGLVVGELVMNACKYAFPGGRGGSISVSLVRKDSAGLELRVRDDGIGIARTRAEGTRRGAGIGLGIVESLVTQEGGTVLEEDTEGGTSILCSFRQDRDLRIPSWAPAEAGTR